MTSSSTNPIRVLIVDDQTLVREGLRQLLQYQAGLVVVGAVANREDALAMAAHEQPDIILLDLDLAGDNSLGLLPGLRDVGRQARVIVITGSPATEEHQRAIVLGAMGIVLKGSSGVAELMQAIQHVHDGEIWISRSLMVHVLTTMGEARDLTHADPEASRIATLTDREREIIPLVCEGLANQEIAARLHVSEGTVRHYLGLIFKKLDVAGRNKLTSYAHQHHLDGPTS